MKVLKSLIIVFLILLTDHLLANSQQVESKPTVIYFYTDWCSYCGMQQKQIEKNTGLNATLNNDFHFIKFNAESKEEIKFNGKAYKTGKDRTHDFVKYFLQKDKQIAYPFWVILNKDYQIIFTHEGLIKAKDLKEILNSILKNRPDK